MRKLLAIAGLMPTLLSAQTPAPPRAAAAHLSVPEKTATRAIVAFYDLNDLTHDQLHRAIGALATWIDTKMEAGDVLAIATAGEPVSVVADFTHDRSRLHATLESFDASAAVAPADGVTTFRTMTAICNDLARGRPKRVLMFISAGLEPATGLGAARDAERTCFGADVSITRVDPHQLTVR
jgi:hypothetical protein